MAGAMANVLIVDDDRDIAEVTAEVLACEGHTVRIAEDGEAGVHLMGQLLPDLLVLDVEMPKLSGPEMALRLLVDDAGKERVPIVLLSGAADLAAASLLVGTPYVLAKPCHLVALLETVKLALTERTQPHPKAPGFA